MLEKEIGLLLIVGTIIFIFVATGLVVIFLLFYKKKKRLNSIQANLEKNLKEEISKAKLEIQESTLKNIAWELHDNIAQKLVLANLQIQMAPVDEPWLLDIKVLINESLSEIRSLSKSINPETLKNHNLIEAIEKELDRMNRLRTINTNLEIIDTEFYRLNQKIELILFRIVQEFFTNTLKHGKAKNLNVNIHCFASGIKIEAVDDGVGFDSNIKNNEGQGISNMLERAKILKSEISITSQKRIGTKLVLTYND